MSEKPAKLGLASMVIVALVLTGSYLLSFGPACWISQRTGMDGTVVSAVYQPVLQVAWRCPQPIGACLMHYSRLGMEPSYCEVLWQDDATGYCRWSHEVIFACVW
ncbi:MAG TPA: hypothetical protein VHB77_14175 [Planctomycetaceae bacterium]|nr:hypothetical protein [Planctomycetaceae bacterium]